MREELDSLFDYVDYQYPREGIKRLLLIGDGARISGLPQHFHNAIGVEVRSVTPNDIVENSPLVFPKASHPAMMVAVGLAMFAGE